ncbi:MAG: ribulose-phosphate 3-epimerase, partial [Acetobacteraceae bacterium]
LQRIQNGGAKAGLVLNPATPVELLRYELWRLDWVLIMSVNPGFGGQKFIAESLRKIADVRRLIDESGHEIRLAVDGGVDVENIGAVARAGADTFISGSAIFKSGDYAATIKRMRAELAAASEA